MRYVAAALVVLAVLGAGSPARAQRGPSPAARVDHSETLDLAVGENKTLSAVDVVNYSEGAPGVADVKLTTDGGQFVVIGLKAGSTTLLLIYKDGSHRTWTLNVFARSPNDVERELSQLLVGSVGVHVRRVGARFFIEGGVSTEADQKRFQHVAALYPGQVDSLVEVGSIAQDRQFNIRIDFFFTQFDRNSGYLVGVAWPAAVGGDAVVSNQLTFDFIRQATTTATASIVNQPLPSLDVAAHHGWAKVLRQATIITGNGSEAKFSNGGEQNFAITNNLTANIRPIEFGLNLSILPRFDTASRDMEVKVAADVEDLVPPGAATNLPGRSTSRVETIVHLKLGQSIVLSGISTRSRRHAVTGLPLLSEIPVLGVLFGSHQQEDADTEGAIFVIPSVIDVLPPASAGLVDNALHQYEAFSGRMAPAYPHTLTPPVVEPAGR